MKQHAHAAPVNLVYLLRSGTYGDELVEVIGYSK